MSVDEAAVAAVMLVLVVVVVLVAATAAKIQPLFKKPTLRFDKTLIRLTRTLYQFLLAYPIFIHPLNHRR
jgi:hypothetical protein